MKKIIYLWDKKYGTKTTRLQKIEIEQDCCISKETHKRKSCKIVEFIKKMFKEK